MTWTLMVIFLINDLDLDVIRRREFENNVNAVHSKALFNSGKKSCLKDMVTQFF